MQRVLLIDPCVDTLESLAFLLHRWGHDVRTANSGHTGLAIAASFIPTVVFMEIRLPQMNGYEVARRLRAMPALDAVKLVAVSGWETANHSRLCREAGFDLHYSKPVPPNSLRFLLDDCCLPEADPPSFREHCLPNRVTFLLLRG